MKKSILILVLLIVALTATINLSSCKKKDDPTPSSNNSYTGHCTNEVYNYWFNKQHYTGTDTLYITRSFNGYDADTISMDVTTTIAGDLIHECSDDLGARHMKGQVYNKAKTFVRNYDLSAFPGDSVVFVIQ